MRLLSALAVSFVVVAALVACQAGDGSNSAALKVGDCYSLGSGVDSNGDNVATYNVVDCATTHDGEIFSAFDYPNASAWPGYEAIGAYRQPKCQTDFQAYVGTPYGQSSYSINYVSPTEESWEAGDRTIKCRLEDASSGKLTGSARGSKK